MSEDLFYILPVNDISQCHDRQAAFNRVSVKITHKFSKFYLIYKLYSIVNVRDRIAMCQSPDLAVTILFIVKFPLKLKNPPCSGFFSI